MTIQLGPIEGKQTKLKQARMQVAATGGNSCNLSQTNRKLFIILKHQRDTQSSLSLRFLRTTKKQQVDFSRFIWLKSTVQTVVELYWTDIQIMLLQFHFDSDFDSDSDSNDSLPI